MNILLLNWRDIKNPRSGGAEVLTHEMAKRWVGMGNHVTQFSEYFPGAARKEVIDSVNLIRGGNAKLLSFHMPIQLSAYLWHKGCKGKFDVVIDEIHGIPFFTPLFVKEKKIALICEVAGEIWDAIFPFPLNIIGKYIEKNYFRFYKNIPFLTISESTKNDLIKEGIFENLITILPMGLSIPKKIPTFSKEKKKTMLFVGRLTKAKGVEDAITAFETVKKTYPYSALWIIGRGDASYTFYLKSLVRKKQLTHDIKFYGFVSQAEKLKLMSKAHVLVVPSVKEGWGLIVPEAGFCKTPAVVYNTHGLRDIVQHKKNGIIVEKNPESLSLGISSLFENKKLYDSVQKGAYLYAKKQNWENTATTALNVLRSR